MKEMRPTTGKTLLALFNILGPIYDLAFLDLFSGSGQIAITAYRKGATPVYSVETVRKRHSDIVKKAPSEVKCLCMDVRRAVKKLAKENRKFDIIFADPPYDLGWGKEFPKLIATFSEIVSDNGVVVFEHASREIAEDLPEEIWSREDRTYGKSILTFYRKKA